MKMKIWISIVLTITAISTYAGSDAYFVFAFNDAKSTAIALPKKADFVSMPLSISSNQKNPNDRFSEIKQAQNMIMDAAKGNPNLIVHKGQISLSPKPLSKMSSLSSFGHDRSSEAQFYVMAKLDEDTDIYKASSFIRQFIDSISMPGKSSTSLGSIQLAVQNPEKYRTELLKEISKDVAFVKSTIGANGNISISGLEQPVLVRQVDDQMIELFINYSMTINMVEPAH